MSVFLNVFLSLKKTFRFGQFWSTRADFYRDLAQAVQDKELLRDFVDGEYQIASASKTRDRSREAALSTMRDVMLAGATNLHEVLMSVMPEVDSMGLAVARDSKDSASALRTLASNIEDRQSMIKVVRSALASPALLVPVAFAFAYILSSRSIPAFEKAAPPEVWQGFASLVRDAAWLVTAWGLEIISVLVCSLVWFITWGLPNITAAWRFRAEQESGWRALPWYLLGPVKPVLGVYRDMQAASILSDISVYLASGRGLQESISDLADNATPWASQHLHFIVEHLHLHPGDYAGAFGQGLLGPRMLARLQSMVRRDAGHEFSKVLIEISTSGQARAREDVRKASLRANLGLLIVTLGTVVFFYAGQAWIVYRIQEESSPQKLMLKAQQRSAPISDGISR